MGSFLAQLIFSILPTVAKALLERLLKKPPEQPKQTADGALLEVAKEQAEVQRENNKIQAQPLSADDAVARLRERAARAYPGKPGNSGGA